MRVELKYINIEYSKKDDLYIDELTKYIEQNSKEIVEFFDITNFKNKVEVKLWDDLEKYRKRNFNICNNVGNSVEDVPKWSCGFTYVIDNTSYIETLCLSEYVKTKSHETGTLDDLKYLIMHEFTHACHFKINEKSCKWLSEGLATMISKQYKNCKLKLDATLEQIKNDCYVDYTNYYTIIYYIYETYGKNYILKLINDYELQKLEIEKLYRETLDYIRKNSF